MTLDTTTILIIAGAAILLLLLVVLLLRGRRQSVIARPEQDKADPYKVSGERAYVSADTTNKQELPVPLAPPPVPEPVPVKVDIAPPPIPVLGEIAGIAIPPHATDAPDDLTRLKGVGPKLAAKLNELGISRFDQFAALTDDELAAIDGQLGAFAGRLARDRVVEQARFLTAGDTAGFEAVFGKLG